MSVSAIKARILRAEKARAAGREPGCWGGPPGRRKDEAEKAATRKARIARHTESRRRKALEAARKEAIYKASLERKRLRYYLGDRREKKLAQMRAYREGKLK